MAGWFFCVSVLIHVCVILSVKAQSVGQEGSCRTPENRLGTCIPVSNCKHVSDIIDNTRRPFPQAIKDLLRSYQCSFKKSKPKVCCPLQSIEPTQTNENGIPEPPDVSGHKNFNLLPKECGLLNIAERIAYGNKTGLFEFPWMALLSYRTQKGPDFKCGATIINERYILTAAHCIKHLRFPLLKVRIGEHDISTETDCIETKYGDKICAPPYQDLTIEEIIPHPQYDKKSFTYDIGLVRVAFRMNLTLENVQPICLPVDTARKYNFANRNVLISGWGVTETGRTSPDLLKALLPAVPLEECKKTYENIANLNYRQICAGGKTKSDSCGGDSGGPLQVVDSLYDDDRMVQQGIVSFGPRDCGDLALPGIYTKVAFYMDWILDNMVP